MGGVCTEAGCARGWGAHGGGVYTGVGCAWGRGVHGGGVCVGERVRTGESGRLRSGRPAELNVGVAAFSVAAFFLAY